VKPQGPFIGRPQARHCEALFAHRAPAATALVKAPPPVFPAERLARELSARLTRLLGGITPRVTCAGAEAMATSEMVERVGTFAANTLFDAGAMALCTSISVDAVLRLLDRSFGGRGEAPSPLPSALPLSAELLIERLEAIVAEALSAVFGEADETPVAVLRRHSNCAQLAPFPHDEPLALHAFTIAAGDSAGSDWTLLVAYPPARYAVSENADPAETPARRGVPADAGAAPYCAIPLTLGAVLVDMQMPLARIAGLKVGDVLPVSVARSVPLLAGGKRIGAGSIGSFDDRVALQLTDTF
jgi:flagellar motor switch protein FliM